MQLVRGLRTSDLSPGCPAQRGSAAGACDRPEDQWHPRRHLLRTFASCPAGAKRPAPACPRLPSRHPALAARRSRAYHCGMREGRVIGRTALGMAGGHFVTGLSRAGRRPTSGVRGNYGPAPCPLSAALAPGGTAMPPQRAVRPDRPVFCQPSAGFRRAGERGPSDRRAGGSVRLGKMGRWPTPISPAAAAGRSPRVFPAGGR